MLGGEGSPGIIPGVPVLLRRSEIPCHRGAGGGGGGGGGRYSQDNPGSAGVTPVFWDTLPQGCWGGGEVVPGNPGTAGVTPAYRDTLPQGCWGGKVVPG